MKRFADVSFNMKVKNQSINSRNTLKANRKAANTLREYLKEKEMDTDFIKFSESQLAEVLSHFYMDARRPDGEHYKIGSLQNFRYSLNRYLRSSPYNRQFDIIKDRVFYSANENFRLAVEELQKMGKDKVEHRPLISNQDLRKLYEFLHTNCDTPVGLYNKVQFDVRLFFFRRGIENLNVMTKSTLKVECDPHSGLKYITLSKEKTKGRNRDQYNRQESSGFSSIYNLIPELVNTPLCPVKSFEKYLSKLHPLCDRLWQRPREAVSANEAVWFYNSPVGEKTMAGFMKKLSRSCGLTTIYTNHSIRATGLSLTFQSKSNTSQNREAGKSSKSPSYPQSFPMQSALYDNPISSLLQSITVDQNTLSKMIPETTTVILSSSGDSSGDESSACNQPNKNPLDSNDGIEVSIVKGTKRKIFSDHSEIKRDISKTTGRPTTNVSSIRQKHWRQKLGNNDNRLSNRNLPSLTLNNNLEQSTTTIPGVAEWTFDNIRSDMDVSTSQNYLNPSSSSPTINSYNLNDQNSVIETKPLVNQAELKKQQLEFLEAQMLQADAEAKKRQAEVQKRQAELAEAKKLAEEERLRKEAENKVYKYMVLNHEKKILETLRALWKGNQFCDATLQNECISIPVHKILLIACCPKILETYDYIMKDSNVQVCFPRKVTADALKAFVDYLYNGSLNLSKAILESMEYLSGMLGLDDIRQLCNQFRSDMLNDSLCLPDKTIVNVSNSHNTSTHQMSYNDSIIPPPPIVRPSVHTTANSAVSIQLASNFQDMSSAQANNFNLFPDPHSNSILTEVSHIKLEPEVDLTAEDCTEIKQESIQNELYAAETNCKFTEWSPTELQPHLTSQTNFLAQKKSELNNYEMTTTVDLSMAPLNSFQKQSSKVISSNTSSSGVITISPSNSPCPSPRLTGSSSDIHTIQISNTHSISNSNNTNPFPVSLISANGQSISLTDQNNKRKSFENYDSNEDRKRTKILLN